MPIDNIVNHPNRFDELSEQLDKLKSGGNGPYDGGMDKRIEQLEKRVESMDTKLNTLNEKVAETSGKISMLPGYPGIAIILSIVGGALLAVSRLFPAVPPV